MAFTPINVGSTPNDGTGDDLRTAFQKVNDGFSELAYEVGSFTPTLGGATSDPTVTYTAQAGRYVRVGRLVHVEIRLVASGVSGGSGDLVIRGLPAAGTSTSNAAALSLVVGNVSLPSGRTLPVAWILAGSTEIALGASAPGQGIVRLSPSDLGAFTTILIAGTYVAVG